MMTVEVHASAVERQDEILTERALAFLAGLEREFGHSRIDLLRQRDERQERIASGKMPDFLAETASIREGDWRVAEVPHDLQNRRIEITGPTERKMVINALNSGANVFMADFEDSNTPAWENLISGQANLMDAIDGTISLETPEKSYRLNEQVATLIVLGWQFVLALFIGAPILVAVMAVIVRITYPKRRLAKIPD